MSVIVKIGINPPQPYGSAVIPDSSPTNDGVMTAAQAAQLAALVAGGAFPYPHYEHGRAVFTDAEDSITVVFGTPFANANYEFGAALATDDAGVISFKLGGLTQNGFTLTPSVRFTGTISWWAGE